MRLIRVLATSAVALAPTGAIRAPLSLASCPMPVSIPDTSFAERMPIYRGNAAIPIPTQRPSCTNPLFAPIVRVSPDSSAARK